jgi:large subunit ribosomal protein L18e
VNLAKLARLTKRGEVVLVPGKVLGSGSLTHSLIVGAYAFSAAAVRKIRQARGTALGLSDFAKVYQGRSVKIIGG